MMYVKPEITSFDKEGLANTLWQQRVQMDGHVDAIVAVTTWVVVIRAIVMREDISLK